MIIYIQSIALLYLLYEVNRLHKKLDKLATYQVYVYLNIIPLRDDGKPVYNTSATLTKQLNLPVPPIIDAVIADAGNCPAKIYRIKQLENYLCCYALCEVEQESYETCIRLYKELGWANLVS